MPEMPWPFHFNTKDTFDAVFNLTSWKFHTGVPASARVKAARHGCLVSSIEL